MTKRAAEESTAELCANGDSGSVGAMDPNPVESILYLADSYKISHHRQYPPKTTSVYSYFESRGGKFPTTTFFGLQYILKRWLVGKVVDRRAVAEAKEFYRAHFGGAEIFNAEGWNHIVDKHDGYLPLRIKAVPEGSQVGVKNVLFTVESTDPECYWLTNWVETILVQAWYPITVATNSRAQKEAIAEALARTAESLDGLPFKLHDFGYRGVSSVESAGIGGAAHLINFAGTDTIAGLQLLRKYYHCPMGGHSIPAAEHSTITTWGRSGELEAFRNMLTSFPNGLVAVVSDSYDLHKAVKEYWGEELKELITSREGKGTLVIRPDSGDPKTIVCAVLAALEKSFPVTRNSKGYKVLPPYLRVIQGDGICLETIREILAGMEEGGWSADNVVFGSGGALLQRMDRDTQKCAFKCSSVIVDGEERLVYKDPITDPGKQSKKGRLTLEKKEDGSYVTRTEGKGDPDKDELVLVYENGRLLKDWTLKEIRQRAELDIVKAAVKSA